MQTIRITTPVMATPPSGIAVTTHRSAPLLASIAQITVMEYPKGLGALSDTVTFATDGESVNSYKYIRTCMPVYIRMYNMYVHMHVYLLLIP